MALKKDVNIITPIKKFEKPILIRQNSINKTNRKKIRVQFPDGKIIQEKKVSDTMVKVVKIIGIEKVEQLGIKVCGYPFVSREKYAEETYTWSDLGNGWFLQTNTDTRNKFAQLNEIKDTLSLGLKINLV